MVQSYQFEREFWQSYPSEDLGLSSESEVQCWYPRAYGMFQSLNTETNFGVSLRSTGRDKECLCK
jgi:hypothetical protein